MARIEIPFVPRRGRIPGIGMLTTALFVCAIIPGTSSIVSADEPAPGLREGWKWMTRIPAVKFEDVVYARESRVVLVNEKGWLVVRRSTIDDDLEWQVVLARATDSAKPRIQVNERFGSVEVNYRGYFVRDGILGRLRIYRERKTEDSPAWPTVSLTGERRSLGMGACPSAIIDTFVLNQWCWIECGSPVKDKLPDLWVRMQPTAIRKGTASRGNAMNGFQGTADGPAEMFYGDTEAQDEGDLFVGTRKTIDEADRGLEEFQLEEELENKNAPGLAGSSWLNGAEPLSLDKLKGKAVLLYFWSNECKASEKKLAMVEQIHKKYRGRDFVVIGIHSKGHSDTAAKSVQDHKVSFPVMIDDGQTTRRYGVGALPNCFLIDKAGNVVWGYGMAPPTEAQIEGLLR